MYLIDMSKDERKVSKAWNSGMTLEQAIAYIGEDPEYSNIDTDFIKERWAHYEQVVGCACIPFSKPKTDEELLAAHEKDPSAVTKQYLAWRGISGPGNGLRETLAVANKGCH